MWRASWGGATVPELLNHLTPSPTISRAPPACSLDHQYHRSGQMGLQLAALGTASLTPLQLQRVSGLLARQHWHHANYRVLQQLLQARVTEQKETAHSSWAVTLQLIAGPVSCVWEVRRIRRLRAAVSIQSRVRALFCRSRFVSMLWGAIKLQCNWRLMMQNRLSSALLLRLQETVRNAVIRSHKQRKSIVAIQAQSRQFLSRRNFLAALQVSVRFFF